MSFHSDSDSEFKKYLPAAAGVAGTSVLVSQAAFAQEVADVEEAVGDLAGVATAVVAVVLGVMGVRIAIKLVNRLSAKG